MYLGIHWLALQHPIKGMLGSAIGILSVGIAMHGVATWVKESHNRILPIVGYFLWAAWFSFLTFESWELGRPTKAALMLIAAIVALAIAASKIVSLHKPGRGTAL